MRLSLIILLTSFLSLTAGADYKVKPTPKSIYDIKKNIKLVTQKGLVLHLRKLIKAGHPSRFVGSSGHSKVRSFLKSHIKELDALGSGTLSTHSFKPNIQKAIKMYKGDFERLIKPKYTMGDPTYQKWNGFTQSMVNALSSRKSVTGENIVWEKKGSQNPNDILIVGAHYDTAAYDSVSSKILPQLNMPGADNNGSGVAIGLSMIEVLSKMNLPMTIRIIFFDWEELGFLGSRAYVESFESELKKKNFLGFVNLLMLGHDSQISDKNKKKGNMKVYLRPLREDQKLATELIRRGKKMTSRVRFKPLENSFNNSTHISFWEKGFPAIVFSQDWENDFNSKRYHNTNDFPETLNSKTFYASFQFITGAILSKLFNFKL